MASARRILGMDRAFLSRIDDIHQVLTAVDRAETSDSRVLPLTEGAVIGPDQSYCQLMRNGDIPAAVPDVARHPLLGDMLATAALGAGAYCGVPVHLPDGTLYGTLSRERAPRRDGGRAMVPVLLSGGQTVSRPYAGRRSSRAAAEATPGAVQ
nr:GAF domain-containing protein [Geodermatophilus ruber]